MKVNNNRCIKKLEFEFRAFLPLVCCVILDKLNYLNFLCLDFLITEVEIIMARNAYPKVIEDIAFHLDNGQVSEMITTENGYYFLKCISKYEQKLTEENKKTILIQRRKEQFDDVLTTFVENS